MQARVQLAGLAELRRRFRQFVTAFAWIPNIAFGSLFSFSVYHPRLATSATSGWCYGRLFHRHNGAMDEGAILSFNFVQCVRIAS